MPFTLLIFLLMDPGRLIASAAHAHGVFITRTTAPHMKQDSIVRVDLEKMKPECQRLSFSMQKQNESDNNRWCWAATARSISRYYNNKSPWSQCKLVSDVTRHDCCNDYIESVCNNDGSLETALRLTGNYDDSRPCAKTRLCKGARFSTIRKEIKAGRPVGVQVKWVNHYEDSRHFLVIYGYIQGKLGNFYIIGDPFYGYDVLKEEKLKTDYQKIEGFWTYTYFTRSNSNPRMSVDCLNVPRYQKYW